MCPTKCISSKNVIIHNNIIKNGRYHGIGIRGGNTYNINNNLIYNNEGDGINLNSGEEASNLETLTVKNIIINNNICNTNRRNEVKNEVYRFNVIS